MSAHACDWPSCVRTADIKVADLVLCARHWKQDTGWTATPERRAEIEAQVAALGSAE